MTERKLRLIKTENSSLPAPASQTDETEQPNSHLVSPPLHIVDPEPETEIDIELEAEPPAEGEAEQVPLTEAEVAEAARFKEIIAARAARQAMLHRIMAELQEPDEISTAA